MKYLYLDIIEKNQIVNIVTIQTDNMGNLIRSKIFDDSADCYMDLINLLDTNEQIVFTYNINSKLNEIFAKIKSSGVEIKNFEFIDLSKIDKCFFNRKNNVSLRTLQKILQLDVKQNDITLYTCNIMVEYVKLLEFNEPIIDLINLYDMCKHKIEDYKVQKSYTNYLWRAELEFRYQFKQVNDYVKFDKDRNRIFINNKLDCNANCKYCYIKKGKLHDKINSTIVPSQILVNYIKSLSGFSYGDNGTIVTIGSYSECLEENVVDNTIYLIKYFLNKGNKVQVATKKLIPLEKLKMIIDKNINIRNLTIFTSMAVVTDNDKIEVGTDSVESRLKNFVNCKNSGIDCVLYIKPVIRDLTIKDVNKYISIIEQFGIKNVVVGGLYTSNGNGEKKFFTDNKLAKVTCNDEDKIKDELSKYTNVYNSSMDYIMKKYKITGRDNQ